MNKDTLLILAAAGLGLWYVTRMTGKPTVVSNGAASLNKGGNVQIPASFASVFEIGNAPGTQAPGWRNYSDGSAVSPTGMYYPAP